MHRIRCAHCKEDHSSVEEVRECSENRWQFLIDAQAEDRAARRRGEF